MKRLLILMVFGVGIFSGAMLIAAGSDKEKAKEAYDEDAYGPEAPIIWVKPVKSVIFEHKTHTMDAGLDCASCHDDLFEMASGAAEEKDDFTMASIYQGKYCGACHDGATAFNANTRCASCHIGVRGHERLIKAQEVAKKGK